MTLGCPFQLHDSLRHLWGPNHTFICHMISSISYPSTIKGPRGLFLVYSICFVLSVGVDMGAPLPLGSDLSALRKPPGLMEACGHFGTPRHMSIGGIPTGNGCPWTYGGWWGQGQDLVLSRTHSPLLACALNAWVRFLWPLIQQILKSPNRMTMRDRRKAW